jgi:hypothetical protein
MTLPVAYNKKEYSGNDSATEFDFDFKLLFATDELVVTLVESDGTETTLVEDTDYTVTMDGAFPNTGSIEYPIAGDPLATGERIILRRILDITQETKLNNQGGYFANVQELIADKAIGIIQQQQEELDRSFKIGVGSTATVDVDTFLNTIEASVTAASGYASTATTQAGLAKDAKDAALFAQSAAEDAAESIDFADFSALDDGSPLASGDKFVIERSGTKYNLDYDDLPTGASTFVELTDTPADYTDAAGKFLKVNADGDAVEFVSHTIYADPLTTSGDILYRGASSTTRLAKGTDGQVLTLVSGLPAWGAAGGLSNLVSTTLTTTFAATATSGAFVAVTGLTAEITPSSTSKKVLVIVNVAGSSDTGGTISFNARITRNDTPIGIATSTGSNRHAAGASVVVTSGYVAGTVSFMFLDSPETASAVTYGVQVGASGTSVTKVYVNRSQADNDTTSYSRCASTITAIEV